MRASVSAPSRTLVSTTDGGKPFEYRFVATADDVDMNRHVSNIAYVRWLQECSQQHSSAVGWPRERYTLVGGFYAVRRHEIDYLRPCLAGDAIVMTTWIEAFRPASAVRVTQIVRAKDNVMCARARTEWVWLSAESGRPLRVPYEIQQAFR